jgi:uncharacterized membrane protein
MRDVHVLIGNGPWMLWNLFLALVPLGIACALFMGTRRRLSLWWWAGAAAFLAFLPNAPYLMTDVLHVPGDLSAVRGRYGATTLLLVQYGMLVAIGIAAYAGSLELLRLFLLKRGLSARAIGGVQLVLHGACAIGVLLGRFARFNSWDLVVRPEHVAQHLGVRLDNPGSWRLLVVTFVVLLASTHLARMSGRVAHVATDWLLRGSDRHR